MDSEIITIASSVIITTFTPGTNNISSASMGILFGYKKTFGYLNGISVGFFFVMLLCGWISASLREALPSFENILRLFGAGYILWLAWHTLKAGYSFNEEGQSRFGFSRGLFLQVLNPKVIVYGLTVYASFFGGTNYEYVVAVHCSHGARQRGFFSNVNLGAFRCNDTTLYESPTG